MGKGNKEPRVHGVIVDSCVRWSDRLAEVIVSFFVSSILARRLRFSPLVSYWNVSCLDFRDETLSA